MNSSIKVGISSCLLGENVRYDGQHKLDRYLEGVLGKYVTWVSVCPEVECGLSIPRPAMRLVGEPSSPRLVTIKDGVDLTDKMQAWIEGKLPLLEKEGLSGFVFKSRSPSSGMRAVKIYDANGSPSRKGSGLFAKAFMERFPLIPVEDEGRLHDDALRENFIERVFVFSRWRDYVENDGSKKGLVEFHERQKLLLMAHSPKHLKALGGIVANVGRRKPATVQDEYLRILMDGSRLIATVKKNVNVLQHVMGYFKKMLSPDEKSELLEVIEDYHRELTPLIVPTTLLNHYVRKYDQPYLKKQWYLRPHPMELKLRNHV